MSFCGHGHAIRPDRSLVHFRKAMEAYENRGRVTSRAQTLGLKSCEFHPQGRYYWQCYAHSRVASKYAFGAQLIEFSLRSRSGGVIACLLRAVSRERLSHPLPTPLSSANACDLDDGVASQPRDAIGILPADSCSAD